MAKYAINDTTLVSIADAIREKVGSSDGIDPADMAGLIAGIQSGVSKIADKYEFASGSFTPTEDITTVYRLDANEIPFAVVDASCTIFLFPAYDEDVATGALASLNVATQSTVKGRAYASVYMRTGVFYGAEKKIAAMDGGVLFDFSTYAAVAGTTFNWIVVKMI